MSDNSPTTSLNQKALSNNIEIFLYRSQKKNHDEMIEVNRQSRDFFMKHGASNFEVFSLTNREDIMEFVNLSKIISASEEEEVWLEIQSYRDNEHVKQFSKSMEGDKSIEPLFKEFMRLITPGSVVSFGSFSKLVQISY
ncbi:MAG TPA: hypothetical protein VFT71_05650 [Candidatus Nitrosocosmicus sp.]|nr:hypothetical protein [Candidatus Nitrosocosmicus sp.]